MRTLPKDWFSLRPLAIIDTIGALVATEAAAAPEEAAAGFAAGTAADVGLVAGSAGAASVAPEVAAGLAATDVAGAAAGGAAFPAIGSAGQFGAEGGFAAAAPEAGVGTAFTGEAGGALGEAAALAPAGEAAALSPAATGALAAPDVTAPAAAAPAVVAPTAPLPVGTGGAAAAGGAVSPTEALSLANQDVGLIAGGGNVTGEEATSLATLNAPPDSLQTELTNAGINATGSNAAQQASVQSALDTAPAAGGGSAPIVTGRDALTLGAAATPLAMALLRGQPQQPQATTALTPGGQVTAPLIATEQSNLAAANAGTVTPPQQSQIDQFVQNSQNQLFQQLANEGVADPTKDSRFIQGMEDIRQRANTMVQNFITQDLNAGLAAAGGAAGALTTATQAQLQTDQEFQQALSSGTEAFGLIAGLSAAQRAA